VRQIWEDRNVLTRMTAAFAAAIVSNGNSKRQNACEGNAKPGTSFNVGTPQPKKSYQQKISRILTVGHKILIDDLAPFKTLEQLF
jgi:hypothetical protein